MYKKSVKRLALMAMFVCQMVLGEVQFACGQDVPSLHSLRSQLVEASLVRIALGRDIREKIGLSNEQVAALTEESQRSDREMLRLNREIVSDESLNDAEKRAALVKGLEEINEQVAAVVEEVLTPSQKITIVKRFINDRLQQETLEAFFSDPGIAKFLSMNAEQQKSTLEFAVKLDNELRAELLELRRRKLDRLLEERLTADQRNRLNHLLEKK